MLKRIVSLLLIVLPFMFSVVWADNGTRPEIFTMTTASGNTFRIYKPAMLEIANGVNNEKGSVEIDEKDKKFKVIGYSSLVEKIIGLCKKAKVSSNSSNNKTWQKDDEEKISIQFDKRRDLIMQVAIFS